MKEKFPSSIGNVLQQVIQNRKWRQRLDQHVIFDNWQSLVGSDIAKHAQPYAIKKSVLWVYVGDSIWMQQLHLQKTMLLERLNSQLPQETQLTDMRFLLESDILQQEQNTFRSEKKEIVRHPVDQQALKRFETMTSGIADGKLREQLHNLWKTFHSVRPGK